MDPGRELDLLIHKKVMWLPLVHDISECEDDWYSYCKNCYVTQGELYQTDGKAGGRLEDHPCEVAPAYSTDVGISMRIVEKLNGHPVYTVMEWDGAHWIAEFALAEELVKPDAPDRWAKSESLAHAICLAALKTVP